MPVIQDWIRRTIAGETVEIDESAPLDERHAWRSFEAFVVQYEPRWIAGEFTAHSSEHGYTETVDWAAYLGKHTVIGMLVIDRGIFLEIGLRLAAAWFADQTSVPLPKFTRAAVLHVRPTYTTLHPVDRLDDALAAYLAPDAMGELWQRLRA